MKQLIVLVVVLHTICMAVKGEESWDDICKKERAQGNICILSKWICKGNSETQTMQIVRRYGSASRSRSRSPCHKSGGGDRGGKGKKDKICPKEDGYCVRSDGRDQRSGRTKLDGINRSTAEQQATCLAKCRAYPGATGCMTIWEKWNRGCYVYTSEVARGSGSGSPHHVCWVFSKCKGQRCTGQDDGCCTKETPCNIGEGDCDNDQQCSGSLVCGKDNCPWGDEDDCCQKQKGQRCTGQDDGCCTKETPCNVGEGDCDTDQQCSGSLVCGTDNCPWGDEDDCCQKGTMGCKNVKTTSNCEQWKELGYCKKYYVGFMKKNCCKTCREKGIKDTWEEECKNIRKKGNKCELSFGECKKGRKQQTMKITYPGGGWFKKWRTLPCQVSNMIPAAGELAMDMEEEKGIKDTWEEECKKIRKKGNKCELSIGKCNKKWKKQTMKIIYPSGGWFKKWHTLPCEVTNYSSEADAESSPDMGEGGMSTNMKAV